MSRIEEGALQLNYETTSLYTLVQEILDVAAFTTDRVHLTNDVSSSFPEIMVDPARLKQILFNLTSNAIKFTPEGSVAISSEMLDDKQTFVISVADTGIGIDPSHLDIIFEQFGQVEAYETREFQGTGLGLSITKRLVNLHGGRIEVVSTVGKGTTFQVFIPLKPRGDFSSLNGDRNDSLTKTPVLSMECTGDQVKLDASRVNEYSGLAMAASRQPQSLNDIINTHQGLAKPAIPSDEKDVVVETITENDRGVESVSHASTQEIADSLEDTPLKVLAVDDIPINLKVLSNFLIKDGHEVTTASNGKMLLELLTGDNWMKYDVVLLDWMMPIMDGISACRLLRERIPSDLLPVMFLTAKSDPADMMKGFEAGGTDFAVKPFNRYEIMARTRALAKMCRRARSRYLNSVPVALKLLTPDPYWKMQSSVRTLPMFVICIYSSSLPENDRPSGIDGPTLLHFFRAEQMVLNSEWTFCEVDDRSVSFVVASTTLQQVRIFLRTALANPNWIESQVAKSTAGKVMHCKPLITVGVDHRPVTAHLLADQLPMLAMVESPVFHARLLAQSGTKHEEVVLSASAKAELKL
jgi:CheY-like chemotaxis protein